MIKPEQVPMEVCEALQNALLAAFSKSQETTYNRIIAAALNAWPGMRMMVDIDTGDDAAIKLPLPQKDQSDE